MPIAVSLPPQQSASKDRRVMNPMPLARKQSILEEAAYLCTITDIKWPGRPRSYGVITIQPCGKGERYHVTPVHGKVELADIGDGKALEQVTTAAEVANDIEQDINGGGAGTDEGISYFGVFAMDHPEPTEEELRAAEAKLKAFDLYLIREARTLYQRPNMVNEITDTMRRAGSRQGIDEPWIRAVVEMQDCPACGEKLKPGVAVCKGCGAILDRAKALEFGLIREEGTLPEAPQSEPQPQGKARAKKSAQGSATP